MAQYFIYLVAGVFHYITLGAYLAVAAGFSIDSVVLVFAALVLGGIVPGLSLLRPRNAAIIGGVTSLVFLVNSLLICMGSPDGFRSLWIAVPSFAAVGISVVTWFESDESVWMRHTTTVRRFFLGMLIAVPALLTAWIVFVLVA